MLTMKLINILQLFSVTIEADNNVQEKNPKDTTQNSVISYTERCEAYENEFYDIESNILNELGIPALVSQNEDEKLSEEQRNAIIAYFITKFKPTKKYIRPSGNITFKSFFQEFLNQILNPDTIRKTMERHKNKEDVEDMITRVSYTAKLIKALADSGVFIYSFDSVFTDMSVNVFSHALENGELKIWRLFNDFYEETIKGDTLLKSFANKNLKDGVTGKLHRFKLSWYNAPEVKKNLMNLMNKIDNISTNFEKENTKVNENHEKITYMKFFGLTNIVKMGFGSIFRYIHAICNSNDKDFYTDLDTCVTNLTYVFTSIICLLTLEDDPAKLIGDLKEAKEHPIAKVPEIIKKDPENELEIVENPSIDVENNNTEKDVGPAGGPVGNGGVATPAATPVATPAATPAATPVGNGGADLQETPTIETTTTQVQTSNAGDDTEFPWWIALLAFIFAIAAISVGGFILYSQSNRKN